MTGGYTDMKRSKLELSKQLRTLNEQKAQFEVSKSPWRQSP